MFQSLGFGEISDEDLQILVETADSDKDGKISLSDFRGMLSTSGDPEPDVGPVDPDQVTP